MRPTNQRARRGKLAGHSRRQATMDRSTRSRLGVGSLRSHWARWLPFVACLVLAAGLLLVTLQVRTAEAAVPMTPNDDQISDNVLGVYGDGATMAALSPDPDASPATTNAVPESIGRWNLTIEPGLATTTGRLTLVLLDAPGLWRVNVNRSALVTMQLPRGSTVDNSGTSLTGGKGACAAWWDGKVFHTVDPEVRHNADGATVVSCSIPQVGEVPQVFFDLRFRWNDEHKAPAGIGRTGAWLRFEAVEPVSDLMPPFRDEGSSRVAMPLRVSLATGEDAVLSSSFPPPAEGRLGERSWSIGSGGLDLQYVLEYPRRRTWVTPVVDLSLLGSGGFFGLLPAAFAFGRRTRA